MWRLAHASHSDAAVTPAGIAETGRRSVMVRWLRSLRPREVVVFVSSPGDCAEERATARRVVDALNARPEIARQGVHFRPLLWEDLPPGFAEEGDFQRRIDALMRRFGYDAFGIYLGLMKGRLGTPTRRYRSGTIEELEVSLRRRRLTGTPSELLFYFVDGDARPPDEVLEFRSELQRRGLLSASVPAGEIEQRLTANLIDIARSWSSWRNVLRRLSRRLSLGVAVAAGLVVLSVAAADLGSRWQIGQLLENGDTAAAAQLWLDRSAVMPVSADTMRRRINGAVARSVAGDEPLERQLAALAAWRRHPAYLPGELAGLNGDLAGRTAQAIETGAVEAPDDRGVALWRAGRAAGLWSQDPGTSAGLVETLATARLLRALAATDMPAADWKEALLRPNEAEALDRLAKRTLRLSPDLDGWNHRGERVAIAVSAGDDAALARLAGDAVRGTSTYEQPEMEALLATAPSKTLVTWLQDVASPTMPPHIVGRLIDATVAGGHAPLLLALLDLEAAGRLPEGTAAMLEGRSCPVPECAAPATARLLAWAGGETLSRDGVDFLAPALDIARLDAAGREVLAEAVLKRQAPNEASPATIGLLSTLAAPAALAFLDDVAAPHADGRTSFGFAHREALIDGFRRRPDGVARLPLARVLVRRSLEDVGVLQGTRNGMIGTSGLESVERAYLDLLADAAEAATAEDHDLLAGIVARAQPDTGFFPRYPTGKAPALGRALRRVPEAWVLELLDYPDAPLLDPPWDPKWDGRRLMLQALAAADGPPRPAVADCVLRALPNDRDIASNLARLAAGIAPEVGRQFFRGRLASGDADALAELGRLGDAAALTGYVDDHAEQLAAGKGVETLVEAIGELEGTRRRAPVEALLARVPAAAPRLLSVAGPAGIDRPELHAAATEALRAPAAAGRLAAAIGYLASVDSAALWTALAPPATAQALADWLSEAEPFEWVVAMQELAPPPDGGSSGAAAGLAQSRRMLVTLEDNGLIPGNAIEGWMALDAGRRVANPVLALLARHGTPAAALETLHRIADDLRPVETVGALVDAGTVFRAYASWLAAIPAQAGTLDCLPAAWFSVDRLDDANPLVVRAAASLILADPKAAAGGTCAAAPDS